MPINVNMEFNLFLISMSGKGCKHIVSACRVQIMFKRAEERERHTIYLENNYIKYIFYFLFKILLQFPGNTDISQKDDFKIN